MSITNVEFLEYVNNSRKTLINTLNEKGYAIKNNVSLGTAVKRVSDIDTTTEKFEVCFFDIDGTIIQKSYVTKGGNVTPPTPPDRSEEGLVFDRWNCTQYTNVLCNLDIGIQYKNINESETRLYITSDGNTVKLNYILENGFLGYIDWGDGTQTSLDNTAVTSTSNEKYAYSTHDYTNIGKYLIKIVTTNEKVYYIGNKSSVTAPSVGNGIWLIEPITTLNKFFMGKYVSCGFYKSYSYGTSYCLHESFNLREVNIPLITCGQRTNKYAFSFESSGNPIIIIPWGCGGDYSSVPQTISVGSAYYICVPDSMTYSPLFSKESSDIASENAHVKRLRFTNTPITDFSNQGVISFPGAILDEVQIKTGLEKLVSSAIFTDIGAVKNLIFLDGSTFASASNDYIVASQYLNVINVKIPKTVFLLTSYGFSYAGNIDISLADTTTEIPTGAFRCSNLKNINLPNFLKTIGSSAFLNTELSTITIPNKVKTICSSAFKQCSSLKDVIITCVDSNNIPVLESTSCFQLCHPDLTIWVSDEIYDTIIQATNWSYYADRIKKISERVVE